MTAAANRLSTLFERIGDSSENVAFWEKGNDITYADLLASVDCWENDLLERGLSGAKVIGLQADFSLSAVSFLLAAFKLGNIVALFPPGGQTEQLMADARVDSLLTLGSENQQSWMDGPSGEHELLDSLTRIRAAGFILFSSGSTGRAKAILHSFDTFSSKFMKAQKSMRTLAFLSFDHVAGIDTLFYTLFGGGTLVFPEHRSPDGVCKTIESAKVEVLPASPTFFRLLLFSKAYELYDLSSLQYLTYGSEPMSEAILAQLVEVFPAAKIIQKYGMSEFGSPVSKSRSSGELWIHLREDGVKIKIDNDILWIKAESAMVGYLNAPPPLIVDGWLCTGDRVERDGEWIRILGRDSELINVGGEKVYPSEIEHVIERVPSVLEVVVFGEPNAILGTAVCAKVYAGADVDAPQLKKTIRSFCKSHLPAYKVPIKIVISESRLSSDRHKKYRN